MTFEFGRIEGFPTQYPAHQTPVTVDILEVGVIIAFLILYVCLLLVIPCKNAKLNLSSFVRITLNLLIGLLIALGNIGQEWEVGHVYTQMPYRIGTAQEINGSVGLKIGLRSINITLRSTPEESHLRNEIINYNERFSWEWDQGRFGFGPYAGRIQREFRAAQHIGLPLPILWVVDYFVIDGEGFRYGRFYRTAGWYAHITLWTAFVCWILANILVRSVISYGAYFLAITGGLLLLSNLLWVVIRNPLPLSIPFEDETIVTSYGANFWLTFCTGIICLTIAIVIIILNYTHDKELYLFFGVDNLNDYYESYIDEEQQMGNIFILPDDNSESIHMKNVASTSEDIEYNPVISDTKPRYKRRSIYQRKHKPPSDEDSIYQNLIR